MVRRRFFDKCPQMASGGGPGAVPAPGGTSGLWLYYWDKSDDPSREGWWLTKSVGSDDFIVFAPGPHTNVLEAGPWQCGPGQNVEVKTFAASGTGELEVGVYRPGGMPGNGVYQEQPGHPHTSGKGAGRPVYKRIRPLSPDELRVYKRIAPAAAAKKTPKTTSTLKTPTVERERESTSASASWRRGRTADSTRARFAA